MSSETSFSSTFESADSAVSADATVPRASAHTPTVHIINAIRIKRLSGSQADFFFSLPDIGLRLLNLRRSLLDAADAPLRTGSVRRHSIGAR